MAIRALLGTLPSLRRRSFRLLEALLILLILSCTWFCNGAPGPCFTNEMAVDVHYNSFEMYEESSNATGRELFVSDSGPQCLHVNSVGHSGLSNTCYRSNLFFLQSPSSGFMSEAHDSSKASSPSDVGSLLKKKEEESLESQKPEMMNSEASRSSLVMVLDINPHSLDLGHTYLHVPTLAFLTVTNKQKDDVLHVYRPFSSNPQFYSCNYSELWLQPGEVASICFVFHPKQLGVSSAHLVLQTSIAGVLVQAKGFAADPPTEDEKLEVVEALSSGWWIKIVSLFGSLNSVYALEVKSFLPGFMLCLCKKMLRLLRVKKIYVVSFLAVSLMFLRFGFTAPHLLQRISKKQLFSGANNSMQTVTAARKSPLLHQDQKVSGFSVSCEIDNTNHSVVAAEERRVSQSAKMAHVLGSGDNISGQSKIGEVAISALILDADKVEATGLGAIAVKARKEKRKKKKGKSPGPGVTVTFEASSSQSGHSTPSSPLSPVTTILLPHRSSFSAKMDNPKKLRSPMKTVASQLREKPVVLEASLNAENVERSVPKKVLDAEPKQTVNKPALIASAKFPAAGRPGPNINPSYFLPPSSIAPHARAPGPKLCSQSSFQANEKATMVIEEVDKGFTYDIWGDHLSVFDLLGRLKEVPFLLCPVNESDSYSFFAKGPTLMENFHPRYVSTYDPEGK
uniref:Transmembrane protein 131-like N-terminal domain-containing protein n=1 Tax=Kalanchoe fedtschenkoi TaxID=63787 RepID=A0A7N0UC48_KALFE